jgi:hypothetical protein
MTDLVFSETELQELATAPGDRAAAALDRGDAALAREIAASSVDLHFSTRDIYLLWNTLTLGYIEREFGADALAESVPASLRTIARPWAEWFRNGVSREAVASLAMIFRMDGAQLDAFEEDTEKIVLVSPQWAANRADAIPDTPDLRIVSTAIERLCCEWLGYPPFVFADGCGGEPLHLTVYKNPLKVPAGVFDRLGVERDVARIGAAFDVSGALLFDTDEREELRFQAYTLAVKAIDAGDLDRARRHLMLSKTEWYPGHHFGRDLITAQTGWILENHGVQHCWDSVEQCYNLPAMGQMLGQIDTMSYRDQVELLATMFHQHGMKYTLHEDEGGFCFHTKPCGSGGRLIEEGAYAAPKNLPMVKGPSVESFGVDEMPVYCMHCPGTNKYVLEHGGPYFLLVRPDIKDGRITGHCRFNIYKSEAAVPQDVYDRVGVRRPGTGQGGAT